jgi:alpha-L-rhamnosidase
MKKLAFYLSTLVIASLAQAQPWQGQWLTHAGDATQPNQWVAYRKNFVVTNAKTTTIARVAADSRYWLWLNGRLVVFEGSLRRGPNPKDTYYDEVDLSPFLRVGENSLAILHWFWGKHGFNHNNSGQAGLIAEVRQGQQVILASDATWKVRPHSAYGPTGPPHPNYRLPEANVHFDARLDLGEWQKPGYVDSDWGQAIPLGVPPVAPWHQLVRRPIPLWKDFGLRNYVNDKELPRVGTGDTVVAKLPKNLSVTAYLKVDAPAGQLIHLCTDNYRGGGEPNLRTEYVTRAGIQEFESYVVVNGHAMYYVVPVGVKILSLQYRQTGYASEVVGQFTTNDRFYEQLAEKALNTLYLNVRDVISDCPDRERAQWWGDVVINLGEIGYFWDANGHLALRKAIDNLLDWQRPDGSLFSPVPAGSWDKELPQQMLASLSQFGIWEYYRLTGDTATLRKAYLPIGRYLALWQTGADGLVVHRTGGWDWSDWGADIDVPVLENAWYYSALQAAALMARELGHEPAAAQYFRQAGMLKQRFNDQFWRGRAYESGTNRGVVDDRGNGLAVAVGLADPDKFPALRQVLTTEFHASPYMEKYILEAFFKMQDAPGGLARMRKRYQKMVDSPLTTLWEGWDIGSAVYGGGTINHGWTGGPLTLLSQYVAGVSPLQPGYAGVRVQPQLGTLSRVEAVVPTPQGEVRLEAKQTTTRHFRLTVTLPTHLTTNLVGVPVNSPTKMAKILINGQTVWAKGKPNPSLKEKSLFSPRFEAGYAWFELPGGQWVLEVQE